MITGLPPFYSRNRETMFEKIMKAELNFPQQISEVRSLFVVCVGPACEGACRKPSHKHVGSCSCVVLAFLHCLLGDCIQNTRVNIVRLNTVTTHSS
jgi:hypothetical protein